MPQPPADDPHADCRSRLMQAAAAAFLEEGYRVSVDRIAARAGVAKQTLYNHFPGKAELFCEVVRQGTASILVTLDGDGEPLRERLLRFALAYREKVLSPEGIAFYRAVAAEVPRFPELAEVFLATGPLKSIERLAAFLARAMEAGALRRDEPVFAAEALLSLLAGAERTRRLFAATPIPPPEHEATARLVDLFLLAYAPDAVPAPPVRQPQ